MKLGRAVVLWKASSQGPSRSGKEVGREGGRGTGSWSLRTAFPALKFLAQITRNFKFFLFLFSNSLFIHLSFFFFLLRWVFTAVHRLSPVALSQGCSSSWGFSRQWLSQLRSTLRSLASVVAGCRLSSCGLRALECGLGSCVTCAFSCSRACGICWE